MSFKSSGHIAFLSGCSVHWCKWDVKLPHYYCVTVDFSFFLSVNICLIYLGGPVLGIYIFTIILSFSWIDPLIIMWRPSLSFGTAFILKPILSDMSIATSAFFWFQLSWNTCFHLREVTFLVAKFRLLHKTIAYSEYSNSEMWEQGIIGWDSNHTTLRSLRKFNSPTQNHTLKSPI